MFRFQDNIWCGIVFVVFVQVFMVVGVKYVKNGYVKG